MLFTHGRRFVPLSAAVCLLLATLLAPAGVTLGSAAQCSTSATPSVTTNEPDYGPGDLVTISGKGFPCEATLTAVVTTPGGIVSSTAVSTDTTGAFTTSYWIPMVNAVGKYDLKVLDTSALVLDTDGTLQVVDPSAPVLAETVFYDSHFRFSHLTYAGTGPTSVNFTLKSAFRRGSYSCVNAAGSSSVPCTGPGGLAGPGDYFPEFIGGTFLIFGDGQSTSTLIYQVDAIDVAGDWLQATALQPGTANRVIPHTYASAGPTTASIDSCCRTGSEINNPNQNYRVQTIVNLNGGHTASPVTSLPAIVDCPISAICTFTIPAVQADGNAIRFRLSTVAESGIIFQPGPPQAPNAASINPISGTYTWNTTGSLGGTGALYSTQVTIEDLNNVGAVISKSAVDFLIRKIAGVPPKFDVPPTPPSGSTFTTSVGSPVTFPVQASVAIVADTVAVSHLGLPPGATLTCPPPANPTLCAFAWTPTAAQVGSHLLTFTAQDQQTGLNATPHQITIVVRASANNSLDLSVNNSGANTAFAEVPNAAELNITGDWTIESWFKDEDPAAFNHDFRQIIMKGDNDANPEGPYFITIGNGHLLAGVRTGGVNYPIDADLGFLGLDPTKWHHVAVTFRADLNVLNLWLDGNHISFRSGVPASAGNALAVEIGRNGPRAGKYWTGKLDDVRIWNIARTGADISATFMSEYGSPQANLVGNWKFNELRGSGTTSADNAAPAHPATLNGGADFSCDTHVTPACTP